MNPEREELLHRYFDGELDSQSRGHFEATLNANERATLSAWATQKEALRNWLGQASREAPAQDFSALEARLRLRPAKRQTRLWAAGLSFAAAAAVVLFVALRFETLFEPQAPMVKGTQILNVDFGNRVGVVYQVENQEGESVSVIWVNEEM